MKIEVSAFKRQLFQTGVFQRVWRKETSKVPETRLKQQPVLQKTLTRAQSATGAAPVHIPVSFVSLSYQDELGNGFWFLELD